MKKETQASKQSISFERFLVNYLSDLIDLYLFELRLPFLQSANKNESRN